MKANEAPEKIFLEKEKETDRIHHLWGKTPVISSLYEHIEYTRTDAFIKKALKWYCLDCECNDNCKADHKCFFRQEYKRYLEGKESAIPPKFESAIQNPDGSINENWKYRHFIRKMQDAFIKKAVDWLDKTLRDTDFYENEIELFIKEFKKAMEGE